MKVRRKMRRPSLIRPADGLFPLALLAGDLFGQTIYKGWIFAAWMAVRLFGLFSADTVRMAYATQPGMRQVKGSTTLAILMQIAGAAVVSGLYMLVFEGITPFTLAIIGIGTLINIEQVFCEYLYAAGDRYSPVICSILTAALIAAGLVMDAPGIPWITLGMSAAACIVSLIVAVTVGEFRPYKPNKGVIIHAPRGLLYGLAYPVLIAALLYSLREKITGHEGDAKVWCETGLRMGFYAGLALISIVRTPFRRSDLESRTMNPVMAAVAVIAAAGWVVCSFVTAIPGLTALAVSGFCTCAFVASCTCLMLWGGVKTED